MKANTMHKSSLNKNGYQSDDDNVRYKINTKYVNTTTSPSKKKTKSEDDDVRYKFASVLTKTKPIEQKSKPKPKIKVNFWSNKAVSRLQKKDSSKEKINRRHTVAATETLAIKPKINIVKVRKRVSFLPTPLFSENHIPMVTVPDDLTIQLNEEEANDLHEDLNEAFVNSTSNGGNSNKSSSNDAPKRKSRTSVTPSSPVGTKRKYNSINDSEPRINGNENELEFFSKYIVQKLRRMETNQRIYSENLINTVLMLGQLGKLNGKSKVGEA